MYSAIEGVHNLANSRVLGAALLFSACVVPILSGCAGMAVRPRSRFGLVALALPGAAITVLANFGAISSLLLGGSVHREAGGIVAAFLVTAIAVVIPFAVVRFALERRGWVVYASLALLFLDLLVNASLLRWSVLSLSVQTAVTSIDVVAAVALPAAIVLRRNLQLHRLVVFLAASLPVAIYLIIGVNSALGIGGRI